MKTIFNAELGKFRKGERLQFMNNVVSVYNNYDTKTLLLENRVSELANAVLDMDAVFTIPVSKPKTGEVKRADNQRMKTLRGIRLFVNAQKYSTDEEIVTMSGILLSYFKRNCSDLDSFSYQQKTAMIKALVKDWTSDPPLSMAAEKLGLKSLLDTLNEQNQAFDQKFLERARTAKPTLQTNIKTEKVIDAYNELIWDTMSFARVAADKTPYLAIIEELNGVIEDNNTPVLLRASNKKRGKKASQPVEALTSVEESF